MWRPVVPNEMKKVKAGFSKKSLDYLFEIIGSPITGIRYMLFLYYLTEIQRITVNLTLPHIAIKDTGSAHGYASSKYIKYFTIGNNDFLKWTISWKSIFHEI